MSAQVSSGSALRLDKLPPHILDAIFSFLEKNSLCSLSLVSRYLKIVVSQQSHWKNAYKQLCDVPSYLDIAASLDAENKRKIRSDNNNLDFSSFTKTKNNSNWKNIYSDTKQYSSTKWKLNQVFGEDPASVNQENVITTVEFDPMGKFLSIGYQCGQVVVFRNTEKETFKFYTQFESHHPEFDFLTSLEIEEKINKVKWAPSKYGRDCRLLLTTNDKTIKMWKMLEKRPRRSIDNNINNNVPPAPEATVVQRKVYGNAHAYNIHSVSHCSDGQLFISADDLRINLWNMEISSEGFTVVDAKPENMNELNEVITSAEFHPINCNNFIYSTSKGLVNLSDMRSRALCDQKARCFRDKEGKKSFFSDIVSAISDVKWSRDGRYILARDYLKLKIWDVNMEAEPVKTFTVHPHVKSKLYELYENDCIFDKFECAFSHNDLHVLTGSYSNNFCIFDVATDKTQYLQAINPRDRRKTRSELPSQDLKFNEKVTHIAWHPNGNLTAIAAGNYIYLYTLTKA